MSVILLVEDDEMIGRMITMRLNLLGHSVETAVNGKEAVDKALAGNYDLVLMDMHMPIMDGHEATRTLRDQGYSNKIVAVTASAMSSDSDKAIKSGCDDHISKPIGPDFEERIQSLLGS